MHVHLHKKVFPFFQTLFTETFEISQKQYFQLNFQEL